MSPTVPAVAARRWVRRLRAGFRPFVRSAARISIIWLDGSALSRCRGGEFFRPTGVVVGLGDRGPSRCGQ